MRIGVITHWWTKENYGQVLQCYAFQRFLVSCGHTPFLIRYYPDAMFGSPVKRILRTMTDAVMGLFSTKRRYRWKAIRQRAIPRFVRENICQTRGVYRSYSSLTKNQDDIAADLYSVGSDIVWGWFPLSDEGRPFFLDFGPLSAKRISYSASFGSWGEGMAYQEFAGPLIRKLDAVGVRESRGVRLCSEMGRHDAVCVMDPVFLLSRDQWIRSFDISSSRGGVFSYLLRSSVDPKSLLQTAQALANFLNTQLRVATVYGDTGFPRNLLVNPTVPEWVRLVGSSQFVFTNSFHCTALAILFHTPFAVVLKSHGGKMDNRLLAILDRTGLMNRIYDPSKTGVEEIASDEIDWDRVDKNVRDELIVSLKYLEQVGVLSQEEFCVG